MMKKGTPVRQVVKPIEGEVVSKRINEDSEQVEYLVDYETDGEKHQRWFREEELEATGDAPEKAPAPEPEAAKPAAAQMKKR